MSKRKKWLTRKHGKGRQVGTRFPVEPRPDKSKLPTAMKVVSVPKNVIEKSDEEQFIEEADQELEEEKRGLKDIEQEVQEFVDKIRKERRKQKIKEIVREHEELSEEDESEL